MAKIKLTEAQVEMLQKFNESQPKKRIIKISEQQFNRLFNVNESAKLTGHPVAGDGGDEYDPQTEKENEKTTQSFNESISEDIQTVISIAEFVENFKEVLKQLLTNPSQQGLSPFWLKMGVTWGDLISIMSAFGLVTASVIGGKQVIKLVPKKELFKKLGNGGLKRLYNILVEKRYDMKNGGKVISKEQSIGDDMELKEAGDGGYPDGAENDPSAPWNLPDGEPEEEKQYITPSKIVFKLIWYNEDEDGLAIFENNGKLYAHVGGYWDYAAIDNYCDIIDGPCIENYVNDVFLKGDSKVGKYNNKFASQNLLTLVDDNVKNVLLKNYGNAEGLANVLNGMQESRVPTRKSNPAAQDEELEETTTTGSVGGSYVTPKAFAKSKDDMKFGKKPMYKQGKIVEDDLAPESPTKPQRGPKPQSDFDKKIDVIVKGLYKTYPELKNHRINLRFAIGDALSKAALGIQESEERAGQIEFDDCTKLNNNKEAQNGGCSVGAVDDVVKIKENLYLEVAKKTGKSVNEVKSIIESNFKK